MFSRLLSTGDPRHADPRDRVRCRLAVEQLEGREVLSPVVMASTFGLPRTAAEGSSLAFNRGPYSGGTSFAAFDFADLGGNYTADLIATHGVIDLDQTAAAVDYGLAVANNGSPVVTLAGSLSNLNSFLYGPGFSFLPDAYYSGEATVTLRVHDPAAVQDGSGTIPIEYAPVPSDASLSVSGFGERHLPTAPFTFPPGFVTVDPWPDTDGSEWMIVGLSLSGVDGTGGFTLTAGGVEVTPDTDNVWNISSKNPVALQNLLDSVVLTPPAGFRGRVGLNVLGVIVDSAYYPSEGTSASETGVIAFGQAELRFFAGGGTVTLPTVSTTEGSVLSLGGICSVSDPDALDGDTHTLTLTADIGTFTFNDAAISGDLFVSGFGGNTLTLTGTLDEINQFLSDPTSFTFDPGSPYYSGAVVLSATLQNQPGVEDDRPPARGQTSLRSTGGAPYPTSGAGILAYRPAAQIVEVTVADVATDAGTPVGLPVAVSSVADPDGSESFVVVIEGLPAGTSLSHGTDLGGGAWQLRPADLDGLAFLSSPGVAGTFTLTVRAVVTDSAPDLGLADTATTAVTLSVEVRAVEVPPADPEPQPEPDPEPEPEPEPEDEEDPEPDLQLMPADEPDAVVQQLAPDADDDADTLDDIVFVPAADFVDDDFDVDVTADTDGDDGPDEADTTATPAYNLGVVYGSGGNDAGSAASDGRRGAEVSSQGSLFSRAEAPAPPLAAAGDRHPLPPVLPLDQSVPVAGFSEAGGDSLGFIDGLYRTANEPPAEPASPTAPAVAPPSEQPIPAGPQSTAADGPAPLAASDTGDDPAAATAWAAAAPAGIVLAAWSGRSAAPRRWLARLVARLRRLLYARSSNPDVA